MAPRARPTPVASISFSTAAGAPETRLATGVAGVSNAGNGYWSGTFTVPDVAAGAYIVGAECWVTGLTPIGVPTLNRTYDTQSFTVVASTDTTLTPPTTAPPGPSIPLTSVTPPAAEGDAWVTVSGAGCTGADGHIEAFITTQEDPATRLASGGDLADAPGSNGGWSADFQLPGLTPGANYDIGAECFDTTPFGQQVELFAYVPQPFTVTDPTVTTAMSSSTTTSTTVEVPTGPEPGAQRSGYWMLGADGHVYGFGGVAPLGNASGPSVAMTPRDAHGYWVTDAAGHVFAFGTAKYRGGSPSLATGERITTIAATSTGDGYWLFSNRGRAFAFGDAHGFGDMSGTHLNGAIVASAATPSGHGYFMIGSDGGIFAFGDAVFRGSTGNVHLNGPIVGMSTTPNGRGYWLVASDGGVFAFNAAFRGSMGATRLNRPVNGIARFGNGYLMVASDGGIFDFSDKQFAGSLAVNPPSAPIVGFAALSS